MYSIIRSHFIVIVYYLFLVSHTTSLAWNETTSVPLESSDEPFQVGIENGFLPIKPPIDTLPDKYRDLDELVQEIPLVKKNGKPGLLAMKQMEESIKKFPLLDTFEEQDSMVVAALFRDYSFLASAYIFEPCHHEMLKSGNYGLARDRLPRNLAVPLVQLSKRLKIQPYFNYAYSLASNNWRKKHRLADATFENIELIRSFSGHPSEAGFVLVHVLMDLVSGRLVEGAIQFLNSAEVKDKKEGEVAMAFMLDSMRHINKEMSTMWSRAENSDYANFRTFFFGVKNQPMLPNGLIYEGVSEKPQFYLGESGACDSIIPLMDNLLELTVQMPDNRLTVILRDFRACRPLNHQRFLKWVEETSSNLGTKEFALNSNPLTFLRLLDQVREFRVRHWNFVKMYIIQHSKYPVATGGSPIVRWLPNQLSVVHKEIQTVARNLLEKGRGELSWKEKKFCEDVLHLSQSELKAMEDDILEFSKSILKGMKVLRPTISSGLILVESRFYGFSNAFARSYTQNVNTLRM